MTCRMSEVLSTSSRRRKTCQIILNKNANAKSKKKENLNADKLIHKSLIPDYEI